MVHESGPEDFFFARAKTKDTMEYVLETQTVLQLQWSAASDSIILDPTHRRWRIVAMSVFRFAVGTPTHKQGRGLASVGVEVHKNTPLLGLEWCILFGAACLTMSSRMTIPTRFIKRTAVISRQ